MPLIDCPECKKEISDQAPSCPYCGIVFSKAEDVLQEPVVELESPTFTESDPASFTEGSSRFPDWLVALGVFWGAGTVASYFVGVIVWEGYGFFFDQLIFNANPYLWFESPIMFLQLQSSQEEWAADWHANSSFLLECLPLLVATTASVFVFYKRRAKAKDSELP